MAEARDLDDRVLVYGNSRARTPFVHIASYEGGRLIGAASWPSWAPAVLALDHLP